MDELVLAIGNPDTGSKSEAWVAFSDALQSGNPTLIRSTADVVLEHLAAARAAIASAPATPSATPRVVPAPSPSEVQWNFGQEWDAMLVAISEGVTSMRDGAISGSAAVVAEGTTRMTNGIQDHFFPPSESTGPDGRVSRASGMRYGGWPGNAFDGQTGTTWAAGDRPLPQWIEIDLGAPITVATLRLLVWQATPGNTLHRVTGGGTSGTETLLAEFRGPTRDGEWLTQALTTPRAGIRYVRVTTLESPSIVAWREIQVLAPGATPPPLDAGPSCCAATPVPTPAPTHPVGPVVENRLGDGRLVRASSATVAGPPSGAFDSSINTMWNAGWFPPAWIELDLGKNTLVTGIRLMPSQVPNVARTVHRIYGRANGKTTEVLLHEFDGVTSNGAWIEATFDSPSRVRYVRVETVASPSWVAWTEILVNGTGSETLSLLPQGFHDGSTSRFAANELCYANGWASDPDDRSKDVTVRILADGKEVWRGLADKFRADLREAGIGDGTASFWVDLRGLVGLGVAHEIRVQARDLQTDAWVDLSQTPRTMTCT